MAINNKPKVTDNYEINTLRSQMGQRAQWLYFIAEEMKKRGVDYESICREGIYCVGCFRGAQMLEDFKDKKDLVELGEYYKNNMNAIAFEKEFVTVTPEKLEMHFHHCPLVAGWQEVTDDEEAIAKYCDIAMDGDRGIFSNVEGCKFTLDGTIAEGKPYCNLILEKVEK